MKTIITGLFMLLYGTGIAQDNGSEDLEHYKSVYRSAVDFGDLDAAAGAIHHILVLQPEEGNWEDTLARVYFSNQKYRLARRVSEKQLSDGHTSVPMLTVAAYSSQSLGLTKESIPHLENLYERTQELVHLYDLVKAQFSLRRYGECANNINKLVASEDASEVTTRVQLSRNDHQEVPVKAAALNIKGVISMEMGNNGHARQFFQQALNIMPDFALPQQNLKAMDEGQQDDDGDTEVEEQTDKK